MNILDTPSLAVERSVELIRRYGHAASDALLDSHNQIFSPPDLEGLIGFRFEVGCAVVYGDPVCSWEATPLLVDSFQRYCAELQIKNVIYVTASERFATWMSGRSQAIVECGRELSIDPHDDPQAKTGDIASLLRRKVRHARKENVSVVEYGSNDPALELAMDRVAKEWLNGRKGAQIHISHINLFDHRHGKRWFYATQGGVIIGVVMLSRLDGYDGWLLNHVLFVPGAPGGTPEILVSTALETLAKEGCHFVTFGVSPTTALGKTIGITPFVRGCAEGIFVLLNRFFHLDGKIKFWGKFAPISSPSYLIFVQSANIRSLWALLRGLNVGWAASRAR
jgi:lysylphosphatidylglycerol synthetase-like protein (DUF2156 family)